MLPSNSSELLISSDDEKFINNQNKTNDNDIVTVVVGTGTVVDIIVNDDTLIKNNGNDNIIDTNLDFVLNNYENDQCDVIYKPKLSKIEKIRSKIKQRLRFYITIILSIFSMTAGSSLLFLMPLYVDPAISTLLGNFIQHPVMCTTISKEEHIGLLNCTWSSCREGCTSDMYQCVHIYVSYKYPNETNNIQDMALFLVNMNGCGYPPSIQCKNFTDFYGSEGAQFPCFYSKQNQTIVLSHYNRDEQIAIIIKYFVIPFIITCATSIALCIMYCDCSISYRQNTRYRY